jgi:hypothetical protein
VSGGPKRYKLTHTFLWEYSDKRLKLGQLSHLRAVLSFYTLAPPGRLTLRSMGPRLPVNSERIIFLS